MKLRIALVAVVASAVAVSSAEAVPISGQISLGGFVQAIGSVGMGAATGLDFVQGASGMASPGVAGGITSFGAGTGSFAGFSCANLGGGCGSIKDVMSFGLASPVSSLLTLTTGGMTMSFDLASVSSVVRNAATNSIAFNATGTINYTGYDATAGSFVLTAQGDNITSFSATTLTGSSPGGGTPAAPVPEPASFAILGVSIAALGLVRRRGLPV